MQLIKIVLASPSDLKEERTLITNMIERKDKVYKKNEITLDLRRWEDTTPGANKIGGQGTIDDDLGIAEADIFICLYCEKAGTIIEGLGETGTEHELNIAIESYLNKGKPDIKFLLKNTDKRDKKIDEIAKKVQPMALYKVFDTLDDLNGIIDQIITEECNKRMRRKQLPDPVKNVQIEVVNTTTKMIEAVGDNKTIFLNRGFYDLLDAKATETAFYEEVFDGRELIIKDVSDFKLVGNHSRLLVEPRYSTGITFRDCKNIQIEGITIGHTPHKGACVGAVLRFENCSNIQIVNAELFGCGTYGIESQDSNDIILSGSYIYDCSEGAVQLDSSNMQIINTDVSECKDIYGGLFKLYNIYLGMVNVYIHDNRTESNLFSLVDSNIYSEAVSVIRNTFSKLGMSEENIYLRDNIQINRFPVEIESMGKITRERFMEIQKYVEERADIYYLTFDNGNMLIRFMANSMERIKLLSEYCAGDRQLRMTYG